MQWIPLKETFYYNGVNKVPTDATAIVVTRNVKAIVENAFKGCTSLTAITLPPSITVIKRNAFYGCTSLCAIKIPRSVTTIEEFAFYRCTSLSNISMPPSITVIERKVFQGCSSLSRITLPPSLTSIKELAFNKCTSLCTITLPPSLITIKDFAFHKCTSLSTIKIPSSVKTIGTYAFANCSSLSGTIKIPTSITEIESNIFYKCSELHRIEVNSCLPYIIVKNIRCRGGRINRRLGTVHNVFNNNKSLCRISKRVSSLIGIGDNDVHTTYDDSVFVNWKFYSKLKNESGQLPLFTASERSLKWSDGLCKILEANGGAIEDVDETTGLEAFMLAAVGIKSNMETVYRLLLDHPAALNPYVRIMA